MVGYLAEALVDRVVLLDADPTESRRHPRADASADRLGRFHRAVFAARGPDPGADRRRRAAGRGAAAGRSRSRIGAGGRAEHGRRRACIDTGNVSRASAMLAIVEAVPIVMQLPAERLMPASAAMNSSTLMRPALTSSL